MLKTTLGRGLERSASHVCSAAKVVTLSLACVAATACSHSAARVTKFPTPSARERYCAWYGEAREGTLYFGQAPFWSAMRADSGRPLSDLAESGPQWIGQFDLARREARASLDVTTPNARSGVWDVFASRQGDVYFTTFYEPLGVVDPETGRVRRFHELGLGLNEIAAGPEDALVATRYGGDPGDPRAVGALVLFSPGGLLLAEYPLRAPEGYVLAPKTPAWDEAGNRYWVTTDLIQREPGNEGLHPEHPTLVLDAQGEEIARIEDVEVHFVRFDPGGRGVAAFVADSALRLVELSPGPPEAQLRPHSGTLLDAEFPAAFDFVQDISFGPTREVVLTRWSGRVHVIGADGRVRDVQLPRDDPGDLYYSGALSPDGRTVCATRCGDVAVVCAALR